MDPALIGVGGTLAGTVLGAGLSRLASKGAAEEEREHQASELIRQRREAAAVALSEELDHLDESLPKGGTPPEEALPQLQEVAGLLLRRCEKRAALIEDAGITDRLHALSYALWTAADEADERAEQGRGVNIWSLGIAIADLNVAVDAYQLRTVPPDPIFLSADEQIELVGGEPDGMQKINKAVRLRRSAARRSRSSG